MADSELKLRITDAMKTAMKAKDKARLGALRLILAEIKQVEVDERIDPDDARIIGILDKMRKQRRESIRQFEATDRQELVEQERGEIEVIESFLPAALSDEELEQLIRTAIEQTGASSVKEMGKVMALLKPQLQGRADMGRVSQEIKARLAQ